MDLTRQGRSRKKFYGSAHAQRRCGGAPAITKGEVNTFAVGYWHDRWERRPEGWRIVYLRVQQLYFHTFPLVTNPNMFDIKFDGMS
jgi:hypothetical protein